MTTGLRCCCCPACCPAPAPAAAACGELDRLGYSYSALLADPEGRRVFEAGDAGPVRNAAERFNRFGEENCAGGSGEYGVTETGPNRPGGATGALPAGTELLRVTSTSGEVTTVVETTGQIALCVSRSTGASGCWGIPSASMPMTSPQSFGAPMGSGVYAFGLPSDYPRDLLVRDATGAVVPSVLSSNGRLPLVIDPNPPSSTSAGPSRSFDLVRADGSLLSRVTPSTSLSTGSTGSSSGAPGSSSGDPRVPLVACLRAQGLTVPDPTGSSGAGTSAQAYPPDAATRAWQSCRSIYEMSVTGGLRGDTMAFVDCMATQGWLQAVMSGPPTDRAAHNAASARCRAQSPSVRAVVACLRGQSLDILDPASVPGATPAPQRFDPPAASSAWKVCREVYRTASGIPDTIAARLLAVPDCMAEQGWIIVTTTGEPYAGTTYDKAAYDAARATCG